MFTPTGSASISSFSTNVLEDLTGYLGTTSGTAIPNWQAQGTDTRGNLANGETGFTSGGWYGSNNISFSGTGTAENGTGTLRLVNNTGATITGFRVVYTGYTFRNGSASPTTSVSYSVSASSTVPTTTAAFSNVLSSLAMTDAASASGTVFAQSVTGVSIAASNYLFLRWHNPGNSNGDCLGWDNVYFIPTPTTQSSGLSFSSVTTSAMTISWSNGNGRRRAVFVRAGGVGSITNPVEGTKYTANTVFATGGASQLGTSGYYCVYDGTGSTVSVTGLSASTSYFVKIFEYNSDASPTANTITYNTTSPTSGSQATSALCSTPTAYNVTGTGSYCAGGTGLAVGLDNSTTGVNYQLYNGAATVGSPVAGNTGSPISFGLQTIAGTYTVLATTAVGGCTAGMTGSAVITINSLPTVGFSPSAPAICSGGAGVAITASGASTYTWVPTSTLTASTGTTVTATPTTTTTYTITGTSAEGCTGINTVTVSVNPLPTPTISGDVTIPSGGSAVLTFSGTEGDIVYFWNGASTISTTITASGTSTVSVSPAGTTVYSVTSATSALGCSQSITGETATVTISSLPSASISGTASICPGGNTNLLFSGTAGATVFFSTDEATPQNVVLSGTSGIGTYTLNVTPSVTTTYTLDSIVSDSYHGSLSGSVTVSIYTVPTAYTVTGGGSYCSGGSGLAVGLSTSQTDVTYQLYNGGVAVGTPVAGTGSSISFGTFTATGTYSVLATDDNTACTNAMTSTAIIAINALPAITSITTDGPVCQGASLQLSATISGTSAPYSYSWSGSSGFTSSVSSSSLTNTVSTSAMPGTPSTPTYTVVVTDANGCTSIGTNTVSTSVVLFSAGTISGTTSVSVGLTTTLTSNGTSGGTWSSSDETKATIGSASGIVTGMANGTARITYTVTNSCGTVNATTNVTVTALTPSTITSNSWTGTTSSTSTASDPSGFPTVPSATGVVFSQWQRGSGLGGNTGGAYNSNSFASTSLSGAQSGNDYLYFTVTNNASIEVKLTQLFLQTQVSSSGPTNTQLLYKIGSGAEQTFSTVQATTTSGSASTETYSGAACLPPGTTTEFRLYGWGGSSTGTFRVNAGTSVTGSYVSGVSAIGASASNSSPVCSGNSITLSGSPTNGAPPYTYDWNGPSSFTSTVQSPTTSAFTAGGTYTFAVTDQLGCSATATTVSTVNANPVAIAGASAICVAATTTYTNATGGGTWISSNTSVAGIGSTSGLLTPSSAGVTTISYQLVSTGCYAVKTVTVAEMPAIITGATSVCVGGTSTFANSVSGGTWSSSNTVIGAIGSSSGTVSALSAGTTAISYSIVPGCETEVVLTVNSTPTAAPSNSGPICVGGTVTLTANPGGSTTTYAWSGPSLSSTTAANPTATPTVTSVYSLTVSNGTSDAGCTPATVYTTMVTVRPTPTAAPANNGYICVGGTVSLTANPDNGANTYNWSGSSVSSAGAENPTATPTATSVYSLTVSDGTGDAGCAPATVYTTSVTVNSTPTAAPTNSGPICNGGTVNLAANGSASASTYTWSGSSLSATTVANPTATPTTTSVYSLTVSDGSGQPGCSPTTVYTTSVTVNSTPTAAPSNSGPICVGGTVTLAANPGGSTTTYSWSGPSLFASTVANPTATPTVTSVYSLTVSNGTSDAGCAPATVYTTMVTVRPTPTAAPANNGYICVGGTVSLTANPANGANTYNWSGSSVSSATTENPTATPTVTTVYSLTVSDGTGDAGCAPATVYMTSVTVNNTPTAAPTNSGPICNGGTVNLAANGSAGATNYTWSGSSLSSTTVANPTATPSTTSIYSLTVSDGSGQPGCSPTTVYTISVTVNSTPTAAPSNSGPICVGGTVTLTANPGGSTTTYSWSGPSLFASTVANPTATPTVTSVYSLTVSNGTGDAGCAPATVYTTMVTVRTTPTAAPANNGYICVGGTVSLTANPANGANTYNWSGASVSSAGAENPTATPTVTTVYSLTVSDGTSDAGCAPATVYTTFVTVNSTPTAAPTNSGPICNGGTLNLAANGSAGATNYAWSGASLSATTAANPTATPTTTSIYSLTVSDGSGQPGCSPTTVYTTSVTVNSMPTAAPSNSGPICVGGTVTLTANPGGSTTTYSWSGPSLSATTSANPTATPTVTSVYSLTVSNGTSDAGCTPATVYTTMVTVRPTPTAAPSNNGYICVGGTVSLTANPANGANTYNWSGASISSAGAENPTATPTSTSVYSLTVSDGTGDAGCAPATVYTTSVTVNSTPTAAPTNSGPICNGGTVNLAANGSAGATSYAWSGSSLSSTTVANPTATPSTTSVYSLTVSDGSGQPGCSPTTVYTTSVTVNSTPIAAPSNSGPVCVGGTVTLTANPGGSTTTYSWSGPSLSSTTSATPTATPTVTSVYSLTVSNGTSDAGCAPATVYTTMVTVRPTPTAAPSNNGYICVGGTVSLTANPANGANTYNWSGSSVSSATTENPTATPTATSVYSLTVSDGTGDAGCAPATVYTTSVTVNNTPTAAPTNSGPTCNGGTVNLAANGSAGASTYTWSGASLSSTTATNPTATPTTTSIYSLTVSDGSGQPGCSPTTVYTTSVTVNSTPTAAPSNSGPICVGGTVTLTANPGGSTTTYAWSGPSLSSTTAANPTATPTVTSVYSLTVSNGTSDAGCTPATVYTIMVTVRPTPTAAPANNGYICVGGTVSLTANPVNGANTYNWSGASISSAGAENPTATPTTTTVYSLTVSDGTGDAGCAPATVYTTSVTVNSTPTAAPTNSGPTCAGGTINLISNSAGGAATYFWSGPALSSPTVANPVAAPTVTSVYSLTVSDGSGHPGCAPSTVYTTSVTVNSVAGIVPTVVSSGGSTICEGESSSLSTSGADDYIWVPSTGLSANTGATVVATPSATTTYTVTGAKDGCTNIAVVTVSVNPVPQAITGTSEVCKSTFVVLSSTTPMGVWSSSNPSIATVTSTTGQVSGVGGGTATITYTKDGCFTSREVAVHAPAAITSTGYPSMCIGQTYALGHPEAGGVWSSSSNLIASVNSSGLVTGVNYGTATITYTNIHGCNVTKQVTVGMPAPIDGMQWACLNSTIDLDHSVAGGTWSSSNPARATVDATTGVVYGVSLGNFYITYTLFPGCYRAMEMAVQTFPLDISGSLSICEGASTTLANETASGTWSSSDTTVALIALNAGTAIGLSSGTTNITYKFQGCYHSEVLTVNALPTDIVGANELCEGSSEMYSSMPTGGTWMSGNTSRASIGLSSGSAFGVGSGSVLITYTAPLSGCRKTKSILVNSRPGILSGTATVCAGNNTTITSMSDGGTWSSSNLSVATVGTALAWSTTVSGLAAGTTDIVVSSPMGCTRSVTVTVNAAPSSIGGGSSLCTGGTLQLTNAATGGSWTTSISSIATVNSSGLVTGMAPGTAIITYATSLACFVTKQITVNSLPGAIMGPNRVCVGSAVTLTHADAGGTWTSSTPTRATVDATSGQVTGISIGVVYITYNAGSGCLRTTTLTVNPIPAAISGASALCEGTTSAFTNATPNGTWTSSNLSVASVPSSPGNVSGINAGVATITYMVTTTGCFTTKDVTVNARPASISGASQVCVGSVSTYVSAPSGGTWASSMPTRASVDPVSGQVEGISTGSATLTYSFSTGCYRTQTLTVNPIPLPIGGSSAVCRGATTALNAFTSGGTWSSGNTTVASIAATGVVTGVSSGMADITYKLIATGCQVTRQVTVNELPSAISGVDQICIGSDQSFTSLPSGGTWTSSATARATIGSASGTATGIAQGVAVLTYAAPTTGCVTTRQISVNPIPAAITSTASAVCVGNSILLTSLTAGQTWVSTSAAISLTPTSATTASVVGTSSGSALISYVNGSGCFRMITINVSPAVAPITGDMVVCPTRTIQLSTTASGGTWASALTSKATVNAVGLVTGVNAGNVNISYVVSPGCNAVANITVNAIPASIYGATYVCVGDSVDLNHAISGGVWNTSSALTSVNASNGMVTGISTGTSTITYSINSGCWVTAAINVRPTPAPITGILTVPVGSTSALANTTSGGIWSSSATGIATISSSGLMAGVSPGNAIITYRVTSTQCYVTGNATVTGAAGKVADQEDGGYIKVYPNPTNGRLNVEASCNGVFSLYTLDGKLLQHSSTEKPSTIVSLPGSLTAGVYMCRFDGADGSVRVIRIVYQP